jgi:predicted ATPase
VAGFDVRVGAHTGRVLLGGGVDAEGTIRGFTVNIAARMEQSAPVGALRISHDTWRQVRGVFEVQAQPPLQVKGQDEPLATYLVLAARPRAFRVAGRGIGDIETALVGREAELARLLAAFERTAAGGGLQSATLIADAGLGKSRLLHELQHRLDLHAQRCWLVLGRSHPGGTQQPYGLLRDMLAWRLQIADSDGADAARLRFVQGLQPFFAADGEEAALRQAEMLGQLIGLDFSASPRLAGFVSDARLLRDGALAAFATWLQRLATSDGSPAVVLLDDLQWADDASLDALLQLRERFELPLLLVLAARPALLERRADWGRGWERHDTLTLAPLSASERQTLMRALLQRVADLPEALLSQLDAQAEGNPYYAEELVLMLIDDGVIDTAAEPWRVRSERLVGARIPGTLVGVLQARLDALAAVERRALQAASIVGPVFWDEALSALDADATQALPALRNKAMVQARPESAFEGTREENFHHHLLHQVTYDTLLKAERRSGHALAASWLAERVGDRAAEYLALATDPSGGSTRPPPGRPRPGSRWR